MTIKDIILVETEVITRTYRIKACDVHDATNILDSARGLSNVPKDPEAHQKVKDRITKISVAKRKSYAGGSV